jgi:serine/threonine-protein kinase
VASEIRQGDIVLARYRVERFASEGSVAGLAVATDDSGAAFAIKYLLAHALGEAALRERFEREATLLGSLTSPHVPRCIERAVLGGGEPCFVMPYIEGETLATVWQPGSPFTVSDAVDLVLAVCEALSEAHARGAVHRNLTLSNVLLASGTPRRVLITGFGSAKVAAGTERELALTSRGAVLGDVSHMSPEQLLSSRDADPRTDQWAIGVLLHELVTGERPFKGSTLPQLASHVLTGDPPRLRARRPDLPEALEAIVLRCLSRERDARYPSIAVLARELAPFASDAAASDLAAILGRTAVLEAQASDQGSARASSGRRKWLVAAGAAALVLIALLVVILSRGGGPP